MLGKHLKQSNRQFTRPFFSGFFNWSNKTIYPPSPSSITSKNRLFPNYISSQSELQNYLLFKEPLLLNFTIQADPKCNNLTQSMFDILANESKYPLDSHKWPVNLLNITCDSLEAKDLMLTYGVNNIPTIVCLKKQIPVGQYEVKDALSIDETDLLNWIKSLKD